MDRLMGARGRLVACLALGLGAVGERASAQPLQTALAPLGDVERGRAIVASRQQGLCLLCHGAPLPDPHLHGNLAPPLTGVGARLSVGELRQRIVDSAAINKDSIMPSYYSMNKVGERVAPQFKGKTLFTAQQVEDVVAYLVTLK